MTAVDRDAAGDGWAQRADAGIWPPPGYHRQVEGLRAAVGETVYLAELADTEVQLAVRVTDRPYVLLGVIDFPRPDPARGLAPHLVLLDDGRGVNLGRIARITRRPFRPAPADVLYLDAEADRDLLFAERRLTADFIAERSRAVLGQVLGKTAAPALAGPGDAGPRPPTLQSGLFDHDPQVQEPSLPRQASAPGVARVHLPHRVQLELRPGDLDAPSKK